MTPITECLARDGPAPVTVHHHPTVPTPLKFSGRLDGRRHLAARTDDRDHVDAIQVEDGIRPKTVRISRSAASHTRLGQRPRSWWSSGFATTDPGGLDLHHGGPRTYRRATHLPPRL